MKAGNNSNSLLKLLEKTEVYFACAERRNFGRMLYKFVERSIIKIEPAQQVQCTSRWYLNAEGKAACVHKKAAKRIMSERFA